MTVEDTVTDHSRTTSDAAPSTTDHAVPTSDHAPTTSDEASATGDRWMSVDQIREVHVDLAEAYDRFDWMDHLLLGRARRRQFGGVDGRVLDVACGTGPNFRYLADAATVVGIDVSPEMLAKAGQRIERLGLDGSLREMDAQDLDFPDDHFDVVVSSLSTCTIPDPVAALEEMARVCAPDGEIRLLEHGSSSVGPVAYFQEWRADAHYEKAGCDWTHEPLDHVAAADLSVTEVRTGFFGMITAIDAEPDP